MAVSCPGCGGAGCKQCIPRQTPKVFVPIVPMGAVRTTRRQKFVDERAQRYAVYKSEIRRLIVNRLKAVEAGKAVRIEATFYMPIPKSGQTTRVNPMTGKRYKVAVKEGSPHLTTPDNDNLIKGLFDALNGFAWADDRQVYEVTSKKVYSDYPGIEFGIEFIE